MSVIAPGRNMNLLFLWVLIWCLDVRTNGVTNGSSSAQISDYIKILENGERYLFKQLNFFVQN